MSLEKWESCHSCIEVADICHESDNLASKPSPKSKRDIRVKMRNSNKMKGPL